MLEAVQLIYRSTADTPLVQLLEMVEGDKNRSVVRSMSKACVLAPGDPFLRAENFGENFAGLISLISALKLCPSILRAAPWTASTRRCHGQCSTPFLLR